LPLENAEYARVEAAKLRDYLLDEYHPRNNGKARILHAIGYTRETWQLLEAEILSMVLVEDARESRPLPYGQTYTVSGTLRGPTGSVRIRTVWIIENEIPRFLTAYPAGAND
jgi:hypothetical protein